MATTTVSVTSIVTTTLAAASASATSANQATPQGGIFEHVLPNAVSTSNPITLFIIQAGIIIIFCRLLHFPLSLLGQPRVIAEVVGGVLLGPSVLARIPGFKDAIFPTASMPVLNNVANLGLILFLFLIALEVDIRIFTSNWRVALSVGVAGMILPFGMGVGIAYGLYHQFPSVNPINFGVFALFVGTALAITAFPVLCRILSELNLLSSPVGVTVLAAGVGNDVIGWILLALCVALVNNSSGLTALYVLLCCVGWVLFLVYAVKPVFHGILKKTGSIQNGPTQGMVALTLLLVLTSAWFTSIIGVHAIFGGFLVGLICPHDGGFAIKLTEKVEDLVTVLFLPLYFALSGLNTNLGLLNDGITWGYVIAIISIAFAGKIIGGTLAAKANKLVWRESFTIGALMSCKGLVELIVLNIGLEAKILSQKTFTMFVVMALVTTFATSPIVRGLYPPWYRQKLEAWKRGEIDWNGNSLVSDSSSETRADPEKRLRRLLVYLRLGSLPTTFTFISLLGEAKESYRSDTEHTGDHIVITRRPLEVHALRILELTERTSSVMKITDADDLNRRDPVVNTLRAFSNLHDVAVSSSVSVVPEEAYAQTVASKASDQDSDFVLIPWSELGSNAEDQSIPYGITPQERFLGRAHLDFIQGALSRAVCDTGIFISNCFGGIAPSEPSPEDIRRKMSIITLADVREPALPPVADKSHHVFLPFIGGEDDRAAVRFLIQLAHNPLITAAVVYLNLQSEGDAITSAASTSMAESKEAAHTGSTTDDSSVLSLLRSPPAGVASRLSFSEISVNSSTVVSTAVELAREGTGQNGRNAGDIVIVGRKQARLPPAPKGQLYIESELDKTIGLLGEKMTLGGLKASVLMIQAAENGSSRRESMTQPRTAMMSPRKVSNALRRASMAVVD